DKHNYCYSPCNCLDQNGCLQIDSTLFFDRTIQLCIENMIHNSSLHPIVILLEETKKDLCSHNNRYLRELLLLLFIVYKQILLHECEEHPKILKTVTLTTILEISEKINQLPIAEVLNAIDMLVTELPPFFEKYELHSDITWKEWFKKYWWVPPVFGAWFTLKILLSLQRPHYYFSPYLAPRPPVPLEPVITDDPVLAEIVVEPLEINYR
ncbi:MAG: hypothetical protein KGL95_07100, partial [Patescibacteria group bacterium]|nr:hypothetical protein [Patescibacteria group bacterium]